MWLVLILMLVVGTNAWATNLHFLEYDPVSRLTAEDWEIEGKAFLEAVNRDSKGEPVTWSNEETGNSGSITVLESFSGPEGQPCRKIQEAFKSRLLDSSYTLTVCKVDDDWKVVSANR